MTKWLAGVIPGAIAAVIAALVSLPLKSPDDAILNPTARAYQKVSTHTFDEQRADGLEQLAALVLGTVVGVQVHAEFGAQLHAGGGGHVRGRDLEADLDGGPFVKP